MRIFATSKGRRDLLAIACGAWLACGIQADVRGASRGEPWPLHLIDNSSRGADGVRLADVNSDGRMDITTGWEEGGITRVYLHPGRHAVRRPWPAVTVGRTPHVEDAVFVDLDADGRVDVVTCCEGDTRTMFVHWAPKAASEYLNPDAWQTQPIPASIGAMPWMFCVPAELDGRGGVDLVAGGKGDGAEIGWFEMPLETRRLDRWRWHAISPAGWIMSLRVEDFDADGDPDVITTDRKGRLRGCRWLENPGKASTASRPWENHFVGGQGHEVMFLAIDDLDADGAKDLLVATRPQTLLLFRCDPAGPGRWETRPLRMPPNVGAGKGVAIGDIDLDGRADVVFSCGSAGGGRSGVVWLAVDDISKQDAYTAHEISGPAGIKYDRLELLDVDLDGDLDVITCEESEPVAGRRRGLGVFWYENPCVQTAIAAP